MHSLMCIPLYTLGLLILASVHGSTYNPNVNLNIKPPNRNPANEDITERQVPFRSQDSKQQEREQLYEAYNLLHTLAQVCKFFILTYLPFFIFLLIL